MSPPKEYIIKELRSHVVDETTKLVSAFDNNLSIVKVDYFET